MAVPSSGPLELRGDINLEVNGNTTDTNVALHQLSLDAGFSTPDAMSDFYGYSSVVAPTVSTLSSINIQQTEMTLRGCITDKGGSACVTVGFYFGSSCTATSNPRLVRATYNNPAPYEFSCNKTSLTYGTLYQTFAFGCNEAGETIGNRVATTTAYPPYVPPGNTGAANAQLQFCLASLHPTNGFYTNLCQRVWSGYINPYSGAECQTCNASCNLTCCEVGPDTQRVYCKVCQCQTFYRCDCNFSRYCYQVQGTGAGSPFCSPTHICHSHNYYNQGPSGMCKQGNFTTSISMNPAWQTQQSCYYGTSNSICSYYYHGGYSRNTQEDSFPDHCAYGVTKYLTYN